MTPATDFDRLVTSWLTADGPPDLDPWLLDAAIASARRTNRRGRLSAALVGPTPWPRSPGQPARLLDRRMTVRRQSAVVVLIIIGALLAAALAVAFVAGPRMDDQPVTTLPRPSARPAVSPSDTSPNPGSASYVALPDMSQSRAGHTATLLSDGRVLIAGGRSGYGGEEENTAELFDPRTNSFTKLEDLTGSRIYHSATLLRDGTVLLAGGRDEINATATAEAFDPAAETFTRVGESAGRRFGHVAALLPDGRVLIIGGLTDIGPESPVATPVVEAFDPTQRTFQPVPGFDDLAGTWDDAFALPDGRVVLSGRGRVLVLDPDAGTSAAVDDLVEGAQIAVATAAIPLSDNRIAVFVQYGNAGVATQEVVEVDLASNRRHVLGQLPSQVLLGPTQLAGGRIAFASGRRDDCATIDGYLLSPSSGVIDPTGPIPGIGSCNGFGGAQLTALADGSALVTGGSKSGGEESRAASRLVVDQP